MFLATWQSPISGERGHLICLETRPLPVVKRVGCACLCDGGQQDTCIQSEFLLVDSNSVREFAGKLRAMSVPIDILVLNAGLSLSTGAKPPPPRTKEVRARRALRPVNPLVFNSPPAQRFFRPGTGGICVITSASPSAFYSRMCPSH
jgi:hypothetical protein